MKASDREMVLCVRRSSVEGALSEGFNEFNGSEEQFNSVIKPYELVIGARLWLEHNTDYLQLLPYCVFRKPDSSVAAYQRTKIVGEQRLAGNWSVGFGGHLSVVDLALERKYPSDESTGNYLPTGDIDTIGSIWNNIFREIEEETGIDLDSISNLNYENDLAEFQGFIFDNSNAVGQRHLGVLMIFDVAQEFEFDDNSKQIALSEGMDLKGWYQPEDLIRYNMESWSKIVLNYLLTQIK